MGMRSYQIENVSEEIGIIKGNQIGILELRSIITGIKKKIHWRGSIVDLGCLKTGQLRLSILRNRKKKE